MSQSKPIRLFLERKQYIVREVLWISTIINITRGHMFKLLKKLKGTLRQKFFSAGVLDLSNGLNDSIVPAYSVTAFKRNL